MVKIKNVLNWLSAYVLKILVKLGFNVLIKKALVLKKRV